MAKKSAEFLMRFVWSGGAAFGGKTTQVTSAYSREWTAYIDGKQPIRGSAPKAFNGDDSLHNPEDMLMAALSSCHMLSYLAACSRNGIRVWDYQSESKGIMTYDEQIKTFRFTHVVIKPKVTIEVAQTAEEEIAKALHLHEDAHKICFIAQSVNFPVEVEAEVSRLQQ